MSSTPSIGAAATRVRPLLRWPGGKARLLKELLPRVPADAECYCEDSAAMFGELIISPK